MAEPTPATGQRTAARRVFAETARRLVLPRPVTATEGPLVLSGHGCPVRFRNLWLRRL